jgi:class 3 adenylate cyclase
MARGDLVGEVGRAVGQQAALPPESGSQTLVHLLAALAAYHDLWMTPRLLPPEDARSLADLFELALEQAVGELSLLADVELCWVEQITVTSEGDYAIHFDALSGQTMQNRHVRLPGPLRQGELYLVSRATREPLAPLGPMMVYSRCEAAGPVAHGVFSIAQLVPNRRAMYLSRACGHLRWVDSPATLESIRHLFFQLNPRGDDHGHLLRQVAVGLFDLSGYTPLTRQRGPTAAREFVRRMVAVVRESVESRGGTMGAPVGDEVLVYFDAPQAALLAAVDAMRTLQQLNSRNPQGAIHVHVGLDFGMGIVERNDVWGDVINRAKRCQSIARPDEVVISAEMASAVGSTTEIRLERIAGELKGFGQAEVFKVHWQPRESP